MAVNEYALATYDGTITDEVLTLTGGFFDRAAGGGGKDSSIEQESGLDGPCLVEPMLV